MLLNISVQIGTVVPKCCAYVILYRKLEELQVSVQK